LSWVSYLPIRSLSSEPAVRHPISPQLPTAVLTLVIAVVDFCPTTGILEL